MAAAATLQRSRLDHFPGVPRSNSTDPLVPRNMTAMLDAIGRFITEIGEHLAGIDEADRPGTVICLIMTDGYENASKEWSYERVKALITQQREQYDWTFVFLGANIDAIDVGARIGVPQDTSLTWNSSDACAVQGAYSVSSAAISDLRAGRGIGFSDEDRQEAVRGSGGGDNPSISIHRGRCRRPPSTWACVFSETVPHSAMADLVLRPLFVAVAAVFLSASVAHADGLDDQFLGLLSTDGVSFGTPERMIALAHERCNDNQLGRDQGGFSPWSGLVRSPFTTAVNALSAKLAKEGLTADQMDHFLRDAIHVYCPGG